MIYIYEIIETGEQLEIEQKITDPRLETIEHNGQQVAVKRLITGGTGFILRGGCWSRDDYSAGIQNPEKWAAEAHRGEKKP